MENIRTGSDVYCGDEKVGRVSRLIADARDSRITGVVVDRGLLHGSKIVSIGSIANVTGEAVHLSLSREQFDNADGFVDKKFANPMANWLAPPGYNPTEFLLDVDMSMSPGTYGGVAGKPSPFPPSPADPLPNLVRPTVRVGTPVRADDGEGVGEVAEVDFHPDDGRVTRLVLKRGFLGREHITLPLEWIEGINEDGVILRVDKAEVERVHPAQQSGS
jgi:uncharacterized protein YrrD